MNVPLIVASVLGLAGAALVGVGYRVVRDLKTRQSAVVSERDALRAQLLEKQQRLEVVNRRVVDAEMQAATMKSDLSQLFSRKDGSGPATSVASVAVPQKGFAVGTGYYRGSTSVSFRPLSDVKQLETTSHALYRQLQLSPEQIAQYKAAMNDAAAAFEDIERSAKRNQLRSSDPSLRSRYVQVDADLRAKLTSYFGRDALAKIEWFTSTLFLRETVAQVATDLFYTDVPLTTAQATQLVEILAKNMRDPAGRIDLAFADGTAMKADAEHVLSPPQLAVWRETIALHEKSAFASIRRTRR